MQLVLRFFDTYKGVFGSPFNIQTTSSGTAVFTAPTFEFDIAALITAVSKQQIVKTNIS